MLFRRRIETNSCQRSFYLVVSGGFDTFLAFARNYSTTELGMNKIAPHAGVVKRVLRLFDELVKCDEKGVLKDVREAVEGK